MIDDTTAVTYLFRLMPKEKAWRARRTAAMASAYLELDDPTGRAYTFAFPTFRPLRFRSAGEQTLRAIVMYRDAYRCIACGLDGTATMPCEPYAGNWCIRFPDGRFLTLDHITAVARGGTNHPDNLQTLCNMCNTMKGASIQ